MKQRIYEIRTEGYLSDSWSPWLRDKTIRHEDSGETVIPATLSWAGVTVTPPWAPTVAPNSSPDATMIGPMENGLILFIFR